MAKVTGPFMSVNSSGTLMKTLTAANWKGIKYIRGWFKPANPRTQAQVIQRTRFTKASASWKLEDQDTKDAWNALAQGQAVSGRNLYIKAYIAYMASHNEQEPTRPFLPA